MIDNTLSQKKCHLGKVKTIFDYAFPYYICSRSLWYVDIIKNGFNAIEP